MPRIPVRVEPYSSPSRQHRHYKNKRDQVLRALGKAAYINGSHFAIMWVSARGDVETYASEALQSRLDDWFVQGGIAEEAKNLVMGSADQPRSNPFDTAAGGAGADDMSDDEGDEGDESMGAAARSMHGTPLIHTGDVFLDDQPSSSHAANQARMDMRPAFSRSASSSQTSRARKPAPLDTNMANEVFGHRMLDDVPHSAPLPLHDSLAGPSSAGGPRSAVPRAPMSRSASAAQQPLVDVRLENAASRTAFLELRFSQLQQGMCKTVAKAWIKIIEPKKQTRCPYNKGEEGKPAWWPEGVRHKEPDHLMKPERHLLLLTILRSERIQVARLQLATAEVVALIRADRVSLLMDVYRIAREEEKMREAGVDMDTPMTVGVSSTDGWSEDDQAATSDAGRSNSPAEDEEDRIPGGRTLTASKKRPAASALARSASTSSMRAAKRPAHATSMRTSSGMLDVPRPLSSSGVAGASTWQLHDNATHTSARKQQAAASQAAAAAAAAGYGGPGYQQVHGLITPVSANAHLMDPAFMHASQQQGPVTDAERYGYMSAPQPPHQQLYPHEQHYGAFDGTNEHSARSVAAHQGNNVFSFSAPGSARNAPMQLDDRTRLVHQHQQQQQPPVGGALGLQGVDSSAAMGSWGGFSQEQQYAQQQHQQQQSWNAQQQQQLQHQHQQQSHPQHTWQTAAHMHSRVGDSSAGDTSFGSSFDTSLESNGPATPSPKAAQSYMSQGAHEAKAVLGAHHGGPASAFEAWVNHP
jgi:hypothetical protein